MTPHLIFSLILAVAATGCGRPLRQMLPPDVSSQPPLSEFWVDPVDLAPLDLFHGAGGPALASQGKSFSFVAADTTGFSPGYDVTDANGLEWSVKLGPEAQSEVTTSRILWAMGFHQPPTYYLDTWTLTGAGPRAPGRFRPKLKNHEVIGDWSWYENPFVATRPYRMLVVTNLILNSWDWKTSNNKIYVISRQDGRKERQFVVRDVGASLGKTTYPRLLRWVRLRGFGQGTRNDLAGFEQQGFVTRIEGERVVFDYRGIYRDVINSVTPADVAWTSGLMSRLSNEQWHDAFRAGGYSPDVRTRYIRKIKEKIEQGLDLAAN